MRKVYDLLYGDEDIFVGIPSADLELDLQGWGGHHEYFAERIEDTRPELIIEVGSWKGKSACVMADICNNLKLDTEIVCVDTWLGATEMIGKEMKGTKRDLMLINGYPSIYYQFLYNVYEMGFSKVITPFPQTSSNAARFLAKNRVEADLIYIDASHEFDDVYQDIENYWQLLRHGGVMFGDDYCEYWGGVMDAVDEFFNFANVEHARFENPEGQAPSDYWMVRKP